MTTPASPEAPKGPGMGARITGGLVAIGVLAAVLVIDRRGETPWIAVVLTVLLGAVAAVEYSALLARRGLATSSLLLPALCVAYLVARAAWLASGRDAAPLVPGGLLVAVLALTVAELRRGQADPGMPRAALSLWGFAWIVAFGMLLDVLLVPAAPRGIELALFLLFTSKCNDIGGYLIGKLVGGPKLLPKVSPGKTRSGSAGGAALSIAFALAAGGHVLPEWGALELVVFALVISAVTQVADLGESLFKRFCGAKDSSHVVPTFGGALDVIDSLVLAAPAGWALFVAWRVF